jgi:hypothetical protein
MSQRSRPISGFLRFALSALVLLSAVSFAPRSAAAASTETFTSDQFGYSVSYDSSIWSASDVDGGVALASDASSVAITAFDDATNDLNGCITRLSTKRKRANGVSDYKRVTSGHQTVKAPEGAVTALYSFTDASGGDAVARVLYIECRPGNPDQVIRISFETNDDGYADALAAFNDVYATIALGDQSATDVSSSGPRGQLGHGGDATATPKPKATAKATATKTKTNSTTTKSDPVLKGNVYIGTNKAYSITFDDSIWNDVAAIEPDGTGYDGIDISSDNTIGSIEAIPTKLSLADCVSQTITAMGKTDGFSQVEEAPDLAKPTTAKGAVGTMVNFVVTTDKGDANLTRYVECRQLVKGESIIRIELAAASTNVDGLLSTWSDLLGGIKIAKTSSTTTTKATATATPKPKKSPTAKKTPKATATAAGGDAFPDVNGSTFTSPAFGFTFTWPDKFTPLLASGSDTGDVVAIADGTSTALIFTKSTSDGTTTESCLQEKEDALQNSDTISDATVVTDKSNAEIRGETSTGKYVLYMYTSDKGASLYDYLRCDTAPDGSFVIDFTFITPASKFDTTIDDLTAMLDGIKFP